MRKAIRNCPICGATNVEPLHTQRFELPAGHPLAQGYEVVFCSACTFVYADTAVDQSDYDQYYAELSKYEDQRTGTGGGENPFDHSRLEITACQIADYLDDPSARILDVGCANGGLLRELKDLGYENLCGLDPSPVCVENTRALGLEAHPGSLSQPFPYDKFDCIVLSHTLEHVNDVNGAIGWISSMLRTDGKLVAYIEVPDASRYVDFLYSPFQDFNTEHINHFSQASLKNAMNLGGFEVMEIGEKILKVSQNMFFPAIYGFWKRGPDLFETKIEADYQLVENMNQYIIRSRAILDAIEARLQRILAQKPQVIVWGTGQLVMKLLLETSLGKANITAFIDNNPINHGRTLHGIKILPAEALSRLDGPILITTVLHQQEIADQIRRMKLQNKVVFLLE